MSRSVSVRRSTAVSRFGMVAGNLIVLVLALAPMFFVDSVLRSLLIGVKAYETLAVEAAITGNRKTALRALACNPITADLDKAGPCLEEMLQQNRSLLPRFFES
jgi:hypothetical protein